MNSFTAFVVYALTVLLLENFTLSRAVGITLSISITRGSRYVLSFGLFVTVTAVIASIPAYFLSGWMRTLSFGAAIEPLLFTVVLSLCYIAAHFLLSRVFRRLYAKYSGDIAMAMLNCVVMAALCLPFREKPDLLGSMQFAAETGLAFLVAALLVLEGQKRMSIAKIPGAFRGLPSMLLYIGVLAMALYGFVGHSLPF